MQYDALYPGVEAFKAVTLREAATIASGDKMVRKCSTSYRGKIVLVSPPQTGGQTEALAELVDVRKVEGGYVWEFGEVRKMIPFPAQKCGMKGVVWDLYYTEGVLSVYPESSLTRKVLNKNLLHPSKNSPRGED